MISAAKTLLKQKVPHLYDIARFLRLRGEKALYQEYVARHNFGGHDLSVVISDRVAREWYDRDMGKPSSLDFLSARGLIAKDSRFFVLGAHQAVVAIMLSREVGDLASIVAIEGNYHNFLVGNRNLQLNGVKNIRLLHSVVGANDGTIAFSQSHNGMVADDSQNLSSQETPSVAIDTLSRRYGKPDVVMLDIEGYEAHALEGAVTTLKSDCAWYVEVHGDSQLGRYKRSNQDVISFFKKDFDLFFSPDDIAPFVEASDPGWIPHDRFFLIAFPKLGTKSES